MYALIDGSRFYAESSVIYKPEFVGKPILVAAGQGISIASNRRSSDLKIPKFTPIWDVSAKIEQFGGSIFKSNFNTLGVISDRFMLSLERQMIGSRSMRYSVDESFIDVSHLFAMGVDLDKHLHSVRKTIYKETGVATGAGIAISLTLAKAASWCAKNVKGYRGQCSILNSQTADEILALMPVGEVWNIGKQYNKHLFNEGITTALQLKKQCPKEYQKRYGIQLANVILELNGVAVLDFDVVREKKKQIWSTSSYRDRLRNISTLRGELAHHTSEVMQKIRQQKTEALNLNFFVSTSRFDAGQSYQQSQTVQFEQGVTDTGYALQSMSSVLEKLIPPDMLACPIYKVGVGSTSLVDSEVKQWELFNNFDNKEPLNKALDQLNARFGKGTVKFGSQSRIYNEKHGQVKLEVLEDYYTNVNQMLSVKCC